MTSQQDQIQSLIAEIDSVLQKASPRLSWASISGETAQQRQVLERVRNYLIALQQRAIATQASDLGATHANLLTYDYSQPSPPEPTADQMMQTILREMSYLRANLMHPLQADLDALHQRRERLMQEVQHLETQRQDLAPAQSATNQHQVTAELLQVLMSRLQENLTQQIAQSLNNLRNQPHSPTTTPSALGGVSSAPFNPQYEQLQALRSRSDQMLVNLDSTLNVIFESLQRNIRTYQESLSQGLERMYNLGQQSEITFKALVDQLAQQLKQEAAAYLISSSQLTQPTGDKPADSSPSPASTIAAASPVISSPGEAQDSKGVDQSSTAPTSSLDAAIESWLRSASTMSFDAEPAFAGDFEVADLDLSDLELGAIAAEVPELPSQESDASGPAAIAESSRTADPADTAFINTKPAWDTLDTIAADFSPNEDADIDEALKLLEELSAKLDSSPGLTQLNDAGSQFDQLISNDQPIAASSQEPSEISEDARIELDEFYQSLFGEPTALDRTEESTASEFTSDAALPGSTVPAPSSSSDSQDNQAEQAVDLPASLFEDAEQSGQPELEIYPLATESTSSLTPSAEAGSLTDLFAGVKAAEERSIPANPPAIVDSETLASSQLFIDETHIYRPTQSNNPSVFPYSQEGAEEQYTRAAPDENLLPDVPLDALDLYLDLDELTLSRLNEDLSNLENTSAQSVQELEPDDAFDGAIANSETDPTLTQASANQLHVPDLPEQSSSDAWNTPSLDTPSLEEFAASFSDAPSSAIADEPANPPPASTTPSPFTLENAGNLFDQSASTPPPPPPSTPGNPPASFTLEGMADLFGDATPTTPDPQLIPPMPTDQPIPFTLQGMDDLFTDTPPSLPQATTHLFTDTPPSPPQAITQQATTQQATTQQAEPLGEQSSAVKRTAIKEIPPFKPQLFQPEPPDGEPPPFQLEPLDNLYTELPSANADASLSAQSSAERTVEHINNLLSEPSAFPTSPPPPAQGDPNKKQTLDAAFESLLGTLPASTPDSLPVDHQQASGKKKGNIAQILRIPDLNSEQRVWYLGIDVGTTAISASLLNSQTGQLHPVQWTNVTEESDPLFRLPSVAYVTGEQLGDPRSLPEVGYAALQAEQIAEPTAFSSTGLLLHSFKPYLNIAIPYRSSQTQQWEPTIQRSESQAVPLIVVQQTLIALLTTLTNSLTVTANGLDREGLHYALNHLAGVIVNHPIGSSNAYCFNLREAILSAGLVTHSDQIFFVEEAVAALLADLHRSGNSAGWRLPSPDRSRSSVLKGDILVVSAGAIATDLAVISLPQNGHLTRDHLSLRRLAYAGNALDQDIICQLLYSTANRWVGLELEDLDLPLPGEPDLETRYHLQQRLESVPFGQQLLTKVRQVKPMLCQQDVLFNLGAYQRVLRQQELQNWIISPYLQQLNRELNLLLSQSGRSASVILRVICTGGTALIPAIAQWLQQKFPNADIVQDDSQTASSVSAGWNRIANGLAVLPYFSAVLDTVRHQYNDYFLLREVLNVFPNQPCAIAHLLQALENQGINTRSCRASILNLLDGQLPTGLVPTRASAVVLTPTSQQNLDYQALLTAPLFLRHDSQTYQVNAQQRDRFLNYLQAILTNTHQTLDEPLTVNLAASPVI